MSKVKPHRLRDPLTKGIPGTLAFSWAKEMGKFTQNLLAANQADSGSVQPSLPGFDMFKMNMTCLMPIPSFSSSSNIRALLYVEFLSWINLAAWV
jgi:hypothetical protein